MANLTPDHLMPPDVEIGASKDENDLNERQLASLVLLRRGRSEFGQTAREILHEMPAEITDEEYIVIARVLARTAIMVGIELLSNSGHDNDAIAGHLKNTLDALRDEKGGSDENED